MTTRSPGWIPSSIMESPDTLRRNDVPGFVMRYSSKEMTSRSSSSAGEGKPAATSPTMGRPKALLEGDRNPRASFSSTPAASSFRIQKWTTDLERTPRTTIISE
ncbi:MAG: hypothetical protein IPI61_04870 [Syntrophaceae bacterium]|nr:hypothetical protein [Syntrophaceae bacterium]